MERLAKAIDRLNTRVGRAVAWLALLMVLLEFTVVISRYVFGVTSIAMQEAVVHMHASLFMLAAAWTLRADAHVRVDIFYRGATPRAKATVDLLGSMLLLLPTCALILWVATPYVAQAWAVREGSRETSGLGGVYLLKTVILIFAAQLALQAASMAFRAVRVLAGATAGETER
ncbi:TRAP transporter small permease subunit [Lutibaculum baratangense]|uniref:TRAP transporter small permease protein n=1 Tax=Lutibaculum baratangense AMV1 TaxID=631454 RepID=V4RF83_9HYPH|nr:TRAP transporter small permease subunit [Lutibaculum baratangense]ESR24801.1 TRAP dicarboxylate transporter, DctQ subunit, unknown substrate 6 [Lutibaculum baratangense AMV1]